MLVFYFNIYFFSFKYPKIFCSPAMKIFEDRELPGCIPRRIKISSIRLSNFTNATGADFINVLKCIFQGIYSVFLRLYRVKGFGVVYEC